MKKIISLTLCIAVILSAVLSLTGCFFYQAVKKNEIAEKASDSIIDAPINGDYSVVVNLWLYNGKGNVYIPELLADKVEINKEDYSYETRYYICYGNKYYFCLRGGHYDEDEILNYDHIVFGYVNISNNEIKIIKEFELDYIANNFYSKLTSQYCIFKYAKANEQIDDPYSGRLKQQGHFIYDYVNECIIEDDDFKKYYSEPYYYVEQERETSFFYEGVEYNLLEEGQRDNRNTIENSKTKEKFVVEFEDIIYNCPSIQETIQICEENYMEGADSPQSVDFIVFDGELYVNTFTPQIMFNFSNPPPSFIFKYNFETQEFEYITASGIYWRVDYIVNNDK